MAFLSITTWRISDGTDHGHVAGLMREKYFPGLLRLGAENSMIAATSEDGFAIVTRYPSREIRDRALNSINELRSEGAVEFGAELLDAYAGEVIAAS